MASPLARIEGLDRVRRICLGFPKAWEKVSHGEPTFWVGTRMFATFANADNHHGAGRHAVWCKATHVVQDMLIAQAPTRYFSPPYVGPSGWVGVYVDRRPKWTDVADRLREAYDLAASKPAAARTRHRTARRRRATPS